jgi:CHAT domain-containing protein
VDSLFRQSYTTTLGTPVQANLKLESSSIHDTMAAVGIVNTSLGPEKWAELPFVALELDTVTGIFGQQACQLMGSHATVSNVMAEIQSSSWLHLACHGHQNPDDPLKSGLILYDGKLELAEILNINLPKAKFVYFSACETAMGDSKLANEAMHLAGGFIAAGFLGAIGTLWSMSDAHGPKVAEVVYHIILEEDGVPDVKKAAEGLHLAIQRLRLEGAPLHQWMPFIHIGV